METKKAVTAFMNRCQAKGLSPRTRRWYLGMLEHFGRLDGISNRRQICQSLSRVLVVAQRVHHRYARLGREHFHLVDGLVRAHHQNVDVTR